MEKFLILIFLLVIVTVLIKSKLKISNPATIFVAMWCALVFVSVLIWKPNYSWNYKGIYWILGACFVCEVGAILGNKLRLNNANGTGKDVFNGASWKVLLLFIVLAFMKNLVDLHNYGFSVLDIFRPSSWSGIRVVMTDERYSGSGGIVSLSGQLLTCFMYLVPLYAGFCLNYAKKKRHYIACAVCFIPILMSMILTSAKAGFIASAMLFAIGFLSSNLYKNKKDLKLNLKNITLVLILLFGVAAVLFIAMLWRAGGGGNVVKIVADKFFVYAFGSVPAFDNWFGNFYSLDLGFGKDTFLAISSLLGLGEKISGVYPMLDGYADSNVFTNFRALIQDFGAFGGLLIVGALGFISSVTYRKLVGGCSVFYLFVYQTLAYYFIYGIIISPWVYTTYIAPFIMFILCTAFMFKKSYKRENSIGKVNMSVKV